MITTLTGFVPANHVDMMLSLDQIADNLEQEAFHRPQSSVHQELLCSAAAMLRWNRHESYR